MTLNCYVLIDEKMKALSGFGYYAYVFSLQARGGKSFMAYDNYVH